MPAIRPLRPRRRGRTPAPTSTTRPAGAEDVDIAVDYCGLCGIRPVHAGRRVGTHRFPLRARSRDRRAHRRGRRAGQGRRVGAKRVGVGWYTGSCMHCGSCIGGDQHLCGSAAQTIVGHHGGFAERVRAHWAPGDSATRGADLRSSGPCCSAVASPCSVPLREFGVRPPTASAWSASVALGHMALRFLRAWAARSPPSPPAKVSTPKRWLWRAPRRRHARQRGLEASGRFAGSPPGHGQRAAGLAGADRRASPRGACIVVGAVLEPIPVAAFSLIGAQRQISGSPTGSPAGMAQMLDFAARHAIAPQVEVFLCGASTRPSPTCARARRAIAWCCRPTSIDPGRRRAAHRRCCAICASRAALCRQSAARRFSSAGRANRFVISRSSVRIG